MDTYEHTVLSLHEMFHGRYN